jgi:hypothetical protein
VTLLFCGIDWAETQHDVAIIEDSGRLVAKKRISDDPSELSWSSCSPKPAIAPNTRFRW